MNSEKQQGHLITSRLVSTLRINISYKHPLGPPLDELIQHHRHIREHEATDVKAEELSGVAG